MSGPLSRFATISATGIAGPFNLDSSISPFNANIQVWVPASGVTASYSVEYTLDDLNLIGGAANPNVRWSTFAAFPAASSATITSELTAPVSAIRVNVATLTGGSIELKILQSFSKN